MKPLDEHLQDAAQDWHKEMAPTLSSAANVALPAAKQSLVIPLITSVFIIAVVSAVLWMMVSPAPTSELSGSEPLTQIALIDTVRADKQIQDIAPHAMMDTGATRLVTEDTPKVQGADSGSLIAQATVDGFTIEYERLLQRAMSFEERNPLRAATEYRGLGRLCIARKQYAHAIAPLKRSVELAKSNDFDAVLTSSQQLLETASGLVQD